MFEHVRSMLVEELGVDAASITRRTSFKEDLGVDSLDLFELVTTLEDTYCIEIPDEVLMRVRTVGDVADYLTGLGLTA